MRLCRPCTLAIAAFLFPAMAAAQSGSENELDCFIQPSKVVNLGSGVAGVLESVMVDRGDQVKKGQVLAMLDSRLEKANLDLARARATSDAAVQLRKARLDFSTRERARMKELHQKGVSPDTDLDEAETSLAIAQRELQEAEEARRLSELEMKQAEAVLEKRTIRSPINGVVVDRYLSPGELVSDRPILKLAQLDPLFVEVIAPVSMLPGIKAGHRAEVRPETPVQGTFTGRVKIVDKVMDAASGTFGVRIELANPTQSIPAGLKCQVRFLEN